MSTHNDLESLLAAGQLEPFLRHIRFPAYKNLEPGLHIEFEHPITALVGRNGTNKTSILRALQGCPDGQSPGRYWFGTRVDTINQVERPRIIHGWRAPSLGQVVEALKERSPRTDPDYWEPAQPKKADGMRPLVDGEGVLNSGPRSRDGERSRDRWNAIDKRILYLDFRSELSAFDKFFYHDAKRQLRERRDVVRRVSNHLKTILDDRPSIHMYYGLNRVQEKTRRLGSTELAAIAQILGREYSSVEIAAHSMYGFEGVTARMSYGTRSYSEAFAGSGEFAVITLVDRIERAAERSLILLDEPEVSLHPGAQKRLVQYLVNQCAKRKHQVVFATHSPAMIETLPQSAIKVLTTNTAGRVVLRSQSSSSAAAFETLGNTFARPTVLVEDPLAREIIRSAIRSDPGLSIDAIDVRVVPGGSEGLKRAALDFAIAEQPNVGVLLDGDERLESSLPETEVSESDLDDYIKSIAGPAVRDTAAGIDKTVADGNSSARRAFIRWWHQHVGFLPGTNAPEQWLIDVLGEVGTGKAFWEQRARKELGRGPDEVVESRSILETTLRALADVRPSDFAPIVQELRRIVPA